MDFPTSPVFDFRLDGTESSLSDNSSNCQSRSSTSSTSSTSSSSKSSLDPKGQARLSSPYSVSSASERARDGGRHSCSSDSCLTAVNLSHDNSQSHHSHHTKSHTHHQSPIQRCNYKDISRSPSPSHSLGVSTTSEKLSRLRKLSVERGQCSIRPAGATAVSASSNPASVSFKSKPILRKGEALDLVEVEARKKMERGISHATANESLVSAARNVVQHDFGHIHSQAGFKDETRSVSCSVETPQFTFTLPDLTRYTEDFRGFLEKDLIEMSALISLEQTGRLNWWADTGTCQRLWPLATTGDGNCLLHAASLGMWGFHDRLLTLRKTLSNFLTHSSATEAIYRRWRWQCARQNFESGLALTEAEWSDEWSSVLRLASADPRTNINNNVSLGPKRRSRLSTVSEDELDGNPLYESLEEVHVLVLAHVLKRPIIVVSDTVLKDAYGEALAPITFGGIYLPLEVSHTGCAKSPLILTYDSGHFSALVTMQSLSALPTVIPLTDNEHSILPVQFAWDPGHQIEWGRDENNPNFLGTLDLTDSEKLALLKEYLDVVQVPLPACFLDPPAAGLHGLQGCELGSPDSGDSEHEVTSQSSMEMTLSAAQQSKSKTGKQLSSVVKQFGSIGKTVSKRIKKNFGSITRLARTGSFKGVRGHQVSQTTRLESCRIVSGHKDHILASMIHTQKCLPYLQEMIDNYLQEARLRFEKDKELKALQNAERWRKEHVRLGVSRCVSPDCEPGGGPRPGCQCQGCYAQPRPGEASPLYGSGRSQFYVNSDSEAHETLRRETGLSSDVRTPDKSLHLAHSTFYRHTRTSSTVVPVPSDSPDPHPIVPVELPSPRPPVRNLRKKGVTNFPSEVHEFVNHPSISDPSPRSSCENNGKSQSRKMKAGILGISDAEMCQTKGGVFC